MTEEQILARIKGLHDEQAKALELVKWIDREIIDLRRMFFAGKKESEQT